MLENEHLRVIIQQPGRQWLSIGTFGGNIIDVSARDASGAMLPDHLEEFVIGLNIENTANYTEVRIEEDGSDGQAARICTSGPDDLPKLANASSAIREFGASFPPARMTGICRWISKPATASRLARATLRWTARSPIRAAMNCPFT